MQPDNSKILITGGDSMIASYLTMSFGNQAMVLNRHQLDITDTKQFSNLLKSRKFSAVINAAGKAAGKDLLNINAYAPAKMAELCAESNIPFVFLSSARIFDGKKKTPYVENDQPNPVDEYGQAKLTGETLISKGLQGALYYIIRLPMVLGKREKNPNSQIISRLLALAEKQSVIQVANDIIHSPLHACDAANMIKKVIKQQKPSGLYHCTSSDTVSLSDLITFIFNTLAPGITVQPVPHEYFQSNNNFPKNIALLSDKANTAGGWQLAAQKFIQEYIARP